MTATADTAAHRQAFFKLDIYACIGGFVGLKRARGFDNQILLKGDARDFRCKGDFTVITGGK